MYKKGMTKRYHGELVELIACVIYDYFKRSYIWELYNPTRGTWAYAYEYELFDTEEQKES